MATTFNDTQMTEFKRLVARYPEGKQKSALLPALHLAQDSFGGWLSTETLDYVASLLQIEPIEVYEVATFYSMYNLKPVGKFVECLGACGYAPMMQVGKIYKEHLTKEKVDSIIAEYRAQAAANN
jgi:NADH-quinone oxidoreductase subunit E